MPVTPAEVDWIIKHNATDLTSRSLREADAASEFLRRLPKRSPPYIPPHAGGKLSPSPHAGRAGEGLDHRRGTLVVPDESQWIIHARATDLTSRSLRADATTGNRSTPIALKAKGSATKQDADTKKHVPIN